MAELEARQYGYWKRIRPYAKRGDMETVCDLISAAEDENGPEMAAALRGQLAAAFLSGLASLPVRSPYVPPYQGGR